MYEYGLATDSYRLISRGLMISGIALTADSGLVVAGESGLHYWHADGDYETLADQINGRVLSINDMVSDADGRLYAGTLYWNSDGMVETGELLLVERDASMVVVDDGIQHANGLALSPGGERLYFSDTAARTILVYDVEPSGTLARRRPFVHVAPEDGLPDGLTVDRDGYIWCALWFGGCVVRYDPDGREERRVTLPVSQVSSVAFGGPDLSDLYITSAAELWRSSLAPPGFDDRTPTGGSLYRVRTDIQGRPEHRTKVGLARQSATRSMWSGSSP
jgi:D-xylonolactonase